MQLLCPYLRRSNPLRLTQPGLTHLSHKKASQYLVIGLAGSLVLDISRYSASKMFDLPFALPYTSHVYSWTPLRSQCLGCTSVDGFWPAHPDLLLPELLRESLTSVFYRNSQVCDRSVKNGSTFGRWRPSNSGGNGRGISHTPTQRIFTFFQPPSPQFL